VPSAGVAAGHWWGELTTDQRDADAWSLTFDSAPLEEDTEILGCPRVVIHGSADTGPLHWYLRYEVNDGRPAAASAHGEARTEVHQPGRLLVASSTLDLGGDEAALRYRFRRELRCNGELVRERSWERRFPRGAW
jgi:hypothetical protein